MLVWWVLHGDVGQLILGDLGLIFSQSSSLGMGACFLVLGFPVRFSFGFHKLRG